MKKISLKSTAIGRNDQKKINGSGGFGLRPRIYFCSYSPCACTDSLEACQQNCQGGTCSSFFVCPDCAPLDPPDL